MQGKRVELVEQQGGFQLLEPGQYGKWKDGTWYAETPNGHTANLSLHKVTEHDDGTVTVWPLIKVSDSKNVVWHGFLKSGVWSEC